MIEAAERELLEETVRSALAGAEPGASVDGILAELDWLDLLEAEPDDAIDIVFGALGSEGARASALDDVLASALGQAPRSDRAVLLPPFAGWDPPGRVEHGDLAARGLASARVADAHELLVVCGPAEAPRLARLPVAAVELRPLAGIDPAGGAFSVRAKSGGGETQPLEVGAWQAAVALGRRAVAHQIGGACRSMLELARAHALEREQFGHPIAGFQAVRHKLAEALVALESLEAALGAARAEPGAETAAAAKALAGRAVRRVGRHGQQVLAGVGFTTEHSFHLFLKRVLALEGLFGSADAIALAFGQRLLAERRVPRLIEL